MSNYSKIKICHKKGEIVQIMRKIIIAVIVFLLIVVKPKKEKHSSHIKILNIIVNF